MVPSTLISTGTKITFEQYHALGISFLKLLQFSAFSRFLHQMDIQHQFDTSICCYGEISQEFYIFIPKNPFYDMLIPLVNCVEPISLIYHSMPNIIAMAPDLNGTCPNFRHSLRMCAIVFSFPLHNIRVEDILLFLGP